MRIRNLTVVILLFAETFLHAEVEVLAWFEPSRIGVGSTTKYIVEVTDSDTNALSSAEQLTTLPVPFVNDISFRNGRTSTSQKTSIINGRTESSVTQQIILDAIPARTGNFTIPSYTIDYKGTRLPVPEARLTVVERSASADPATSELIFLTLEAPEKLYVGQTEQTTLKLYVADNVRLGDRLVKPDADGFIITGGPPDEPAESVEIANSRRYRIYSWPITITPLSSGKQNLNFQSTLIAQLPGKRNTRSNPFGSSIFDDFFGRTERVNVYTTPTEINVLPLPKEDQPKSFSGAIGQFNIDVSTDSTSARVNEPIMLSLKLSGRGNFSRIQSPSLSEAKDWRSYPPESVFEADQTQPLKGVKRFDYVFIPEKSGTLELPEIDFSFFDPEYEKYVELSLPVITVEVAPSERTVVSMPKPENSITDMSPEKTVDPVHSVSPEDLLLTLDYRPKSGRELSEYRIPGSFFYWVNGFLFMLFCTTATLTYRHRRLVNDPHHQLVRKAKEELKSVLKETQSNDSSVFFSGAQKAVRLAATARSKQNLLTADFPTLETKFRQMGIAETMIDQTRVLFQAAEAHRFSGNRPNVDLSHYRSQLKTILKTL